MGQFDASTWLNANIADAAYLDENALVALRNFTLMWNLFEGLLCNTKATVSTFDRLVKELPSNSHQISSLNTAFAYYRQRYTHNGCTNARFDQLHFRSNDKKEIVAATLLSENPTMQELGFALLVIIYRLRNNLFHGLKSFDQLNDQAENLNRAAEGLAAFMKLHGGQWIKQEVERCSH